ncbi:MAG: hypothetical protein IAE95_05695 [Chitinophagaceae bacterium]|nr:hypothetical protein [Chitinophagaceae bacterium]
MAEANREPLFTIFMKIFLFLLCAILAISTFAQAKAKRYNRVFKIGEYGDTQAFIDTTGRFNLRYKIMNGAVNIWAVDSSQYYGELYFYTNRVDKRNRHYAVYFRIPDSLGRYIANAFVSMDVPKAFVESSYQLVGCSHCIDQGYNYWDGKSYKSDLINSIQNNRVVDSFNLYVDSVLHTENRFFDFIGLLPDGVYQRNMLEVIKETEGTRKRRSKKVRSFKHLS